MEGADCLLRRSLYDRPLIRIMATKDCGDEEEEEEEGALCFPGSTFQPYS